MSIALLMMGALSVALGASLAVAGDGKDFHVRVTNLTRGQTFTPILVVTHQRDVRLFTPGEPASEELAQLAEGGATAPLADLLMAMDNVGDVVDSGGVLIPGATTTITIRGGGKFKNLSLAAMLVPTNDAFVSINSVPLPRGRHTRKVTAIAYDAGSEANEENCANIPAGGDCSGIGFSPDDGEGFVHVHAGIHGIGDLAAEDFDWRNPVALIEIQRAGDDNND